jgi:hypothetical protein
MRVRPLQVWVSDKHYPFGHQKEVWAIIDGWAHLRPLSEASHSSRVKITTQGLSGYKLLFDPLAQGEPAKAILDQIDLLKDALSGKMDTYFSHLALAHLLRDRGYRPAICMGRINKSKKDFSIGSYWIEVDGFTIDLHKANPVFASASNEGKKYHRQMRHLYGDAYFSLTWKMLTNRFSLDMRNASTKNLASTFSSEK